MNPLESLSKKHQQFVEAYVIECKGNATRAALKAGFAKSGAAVQGFRMLRNANIKSAIDWLYKQTSMGVDEMVGRLEGMVRADLIDAMVPVYRQVRKPRDSDSDEPMEWMEWMDTDDVIGYRIDSKLLVETGLMSFVKAVKETAHGTVYELEDRQGAMDKVLRAKGVYREEGVSQEVVIKIVRGVNLDAV